MNRVAAMSLLFAAAVGCTGIAIELRAISEGELLEYASMPYDKGRFGASPAVLGALNDVAVRVDYFCSDVCPDYTVRVIHLEVAPERCAQAGGVEKTMVIPIAIAAMTRVFCFPKILADNWEAYVK
jgi:hypothetical protein